jgi:hypothetical protein
MLTAYEILWLFAFPSSMSSWYHTIRRAGTYIRATRELSVDSQPRIIFSLTARKLIPIIEDCVDSVNKSSAQVGFSNYEIKLVVDQADTNLDGVDTILVPKDLPADLDIKQEHYITPSAIYLTAGISGYCILMKMPE